MQLADQGRRNTDYLSIAQVIASSLGLVFAMGGAGLLLVLGLATLFSETLDSASVTAIMSMAWVSGLVAVLTLPSLLYGIRRLQGVEPHPQPAGRLRQASLLLMIWPLALVLDNLITTQGMLTWLLLPPLHLFSIGLPIWWLIEFARWRLPAGSKQRVWGVINFGLLVTTPVTILVELIVFGFLIVLFILWASSQPGVMNQLEVLAQHILIAQPDPDSLIQILRPYLQNSYALAGTLALLAGLIPLIEELLKPLAIWILAGRRLTPAQGFVTGAICGGTFALLESLLSLTGPSMQTDWAVLAIGRAGTGLLHTTTTALVGWSLARAWQTGSYARLGLTYLLAFSLHGVWNAFSVFSGFGVLLDNPPDNFRALASISQAAPAGIILLVLLLFFLLWGRNRHLRRLTPTTGSAPVVPADIDSSH